MSRGFYSIVGLFLGAGVNLVINLLAAVLQQHSFFDEFSLQSIVWLVVSAIIGMVLLYWLGGPVELKRDPPQNDTGATETSTVTRLRAFLSHIKLHGKGVHIKNIFTFGSKIDINTKK